MKHWPWYISMVAVVALSGCGSASSTTSSNTKSGHSASTTTAPATTTSAPASSTTTSAPATSSTTTATSASTSATGPGGTSGHLTDCTTSQLAASLGPGNGTAGPTYYQLELKNTSSTRCEELGYAGVSFVSGPHGHQVGAAARRVTMAAHPVTLAPGQTAYETLGVGNAGDYAPSTCRPTAVPGLRVYPPDQTSSLYLATGSAPTGTAACASVAVTLLSVEPFAAAPTV